MAQETAKLLEELGRQLGELGELIELNQQNVGKWLIQVVIDITKEVEKTSVLIGNQTEEIQRIERMQRISGAFQGLSLVILCLWLLTLLVRAIFRCVTEKQEARQEEMVDMLERSLQERKSKRRAMAKPGPSDK